MEITIYYENTDDLLSALKKQIFDLPNDIVLVDGAVDEGKITEKNIVNNDENFSRFVKENIYGFFLYNKEHSILANIELSESNNLSKIYFYQKDSNCKQLLTYCDEIIKTFSSYKAIFIYACLDEELYEKNKLALNFKGNESESWVGRNIYRYLPGLYWTTWISDKYTNILNIDIEKIINQLDVSKTRVFDGWMIKLDSDIKNWEKYSFKIDLISKTEEKIFNKNKITIHSIKNIFELEDLISDWE